MIGKVVSAIALGGLMSAGGAHAGGVHWSVGINVPPVVISNGPVYGPPAYYGGYDNRYYAPPIVYAPAPVYGPPPGYWRHGHGYYAPPVVRGGWQDPRWGHGRHDSRWDGRRDGRRGDGWQQVPRDERRGRH